MSIFKMAVGQMKEDEKQEKKLVKDVTLELAEKQVEYFNGKRKIKEVEETKQIVKEKFDNYMKKVDNDFEQLKNIEHCGRILDDIYRREYEQKARKNRPFWKKLIGL